ncbi:MAG: hypothetical protein PHO15_11145, partial [Eubacteriales bacterium]|nr:hypothetical protein [Eubacteriales bacterium]
MFELSKELEKLAMEGTPIHVSLIGTGKMGTYFAQSIGATTGMELDIACDIDIEKAQNAMEETGVDKSRIERCETAEDAEKALKSGKKVITTKLEVATGAERIQVVCESTGAPEIYATAGIQAIQNKKHYVAMCAEGDVCIGNIMNMWARNAGVVYTGIYGDEPGSAMLQYYEAKAIGLDVLAIGRSDMGGSQIKWNRDTIQAELDKYGVVYENKSLYASFCDGSKT